MKNSAAADALPRGSIIAIFGSPLLDPEDVSAYVGLMDNILRDFEPNDYFETIWAREYIDLTWEIIRWNEIRKISIQAAIATAVEKEVLALVDREIEVILQAEPDNEDDKTVKMEISKLVSRRLSGRLSELAKSAARYPRGYAKYEELCAWAIAQIDKKEISARAQLQELDTIERINRQIAVLERRCNATLREIEHHRVAFPRMIDAVVQERRAPRLLKSTRETA